jgi:hypothetical protein
VSEPPAESQEKSVSRKGLTVELPGGAKVSGWQLDEGGFQWVFTSATGVKTVVRLSEHAVLAMGEIAAALLNPDAIEAA